MKVVFSLIVILPSSSTHREQNRMVMVDWEDPCAAVCAPGHLAARHHVRVLFLLSGVVDIAEPGVLTRQNMKLERAAEALAFWCAGAADDKPH